MDNKADAIHVEAQAATPTKSNVGNIRLVRDGDIILVPQPTMDSKDPLNYAPWKKWAILILVSAYSSTAVILSSGMGAIIPVVNFSYPGENTSDLMTYPTLFMGLGNLISMPLAMTIGRRPVFIASVLLITVSGIWCAASGSLTSHIAGRNIMSLAAGQSEALSPLIVQEMFFLHQRSRKLSWFIFIQNFTVGIFFIATQFLVSAHGWRWWYGLFTIINGLALILSLFLAAETAYNRPDSAMVGESAMVEAHHTKNEETSSQNSSSMTESEYLAQISRVRAAGKWTDGLTLTVSNPKWSQIPTFYWQVLQGFLIWPVVWVFLLNGAWLGLYVFQASTFAPVLIMPPYSMSFVNLAFVQGAQVIVCLLFLPLLGYGGDAMLKFLVKSNDKGLFKPEYRLFQMAIPAVVGVISAVLYGRAASMGPATNPETNPWTWATIAVSYNAGFFAFLGANIVGITYTVDSFPTRAGPLLVLICAGRGILSFGLSYSTLPATQSVGYDGLGNIFAIICGVLSLLAIPVYFLGPRARVWADRTFKITSSVEQE